MSCADEEHMSNPRGFVPARTVVITGANQGLGFACARQIARRPGWRVILACRDPRRGQQAAARITAETENPAIESRLLDLASLAAVRRFVAELPGPVDALVCNAGVQIVNGLEWTVDGFEATFAINHLAHFLLANLLLDRLRDGARVVFVSSNTHDPSRWTGMPPPHLVDPAALARGEPREAGSAGRAGRVRYVNSKLCNVYCAYEMSRRVSRIRVNAFDPGFLPGTALARGYGPLARFLNRFVLPAATLVLPNANTVGRSARRLARLVTDLAFAGLSGAYVSRGRVAGSSPASYDREQARRLWQVSCELSGLNRWRPADAWLPTENQPSPRGS
jgi:NAD(P)-dependent dehydrogenase (short-subunit alcohol dehydrogenase family)